MKRTKVFVSYPEDAKWRSKLEVHLKALVRGPLSTTDDKKRRTENKRRDRSIHR